MLLRTLSGATDGALQQFFGTAPRLHRFDSRYCSAEPETPTLRATLPLRPGLAAVTTGPSVPSVTTGPQSEEKGSTVSRGLKKPQFVIMWVRSNCGSNSKIPAATPPSETTRKASFAVWSKAREIRVHFVGYLEGDCGEAAAVTCIEWLIPARTDTRIDFQQR